MQIAANITSGEDNTADNLFSAGWIYVGIPRDVDSNGIVNLADLYKIALHFNAAKVEARYVPECEIDNDGTVNMADVWIAGTHFG